MNSFHIDGESIVTDEVEGDTFIVSSSPKSYEVVVDKRQVSLVFEEEYEEGDIVLIDKNVSLLYDVKSPDLYTIEAVEENKNINTVLNFVKFLNEKKFNKKNKIFVIGGGITQDIGAFACSMFKRGVRWILFPTTLLSMCDSCIGGKTGINFLNTKNQLGLFSSPSKVIINHNFLNTLDPRDLKSGLGEVLKLLALSSNADLEFYDQVVENGVVHNIQDYPELIKRSLLIKKAVIERDEFEFNIRKSLNYGHTIGHAVEVLSKYEVSHGQAVAVGMLLVNELFSLNNEMLKKQCTDLIDSKKIKNINLDGLLDLIKKDKKTIGNMATFVVIRKPGVTEFVPTLIDSALMLSIKKIIDNL